MKSYYGSANDNPFHVTEEEAAQLRLAALYNKPSPIIVEPRDVEEMMGMNDVPEEALALFRRANTLRLSLWEREAIRRSLRTGALRKIVEDKGKGDDFPEMAYVRVDCYSKAIQTPCVLEIWPGGHYSFMHEHSNSSGIVFGLAGRVDAMVYEKLDWNAKKLGLVSIDRGQAAWLNRSTFQVHKLFCPLPPDEYAATFHIYTGCDDDIFRYVHEKPPYQVADFVTKSDISWFDLVRVLEQETPRVPSDDATSLFNL